MDCRVVVEAAVPVYDVGTADEAIRIAISKTGGMLNPDLSYVEIDVGTRTSPSGEALEPAFVVADEALVALELEMTVFNVEREEHASRIARKEIGGRMADIPLDVLDVRVLDDDEDEDEDEAETESHEEANAEAADVRSDEGGKSTAGRNEFDTNGGTGDVGGPDDGAGMDDGADEDILPEFEDLLDE